MCRRLLEDRPPPSRRLCEVWRVEGETRGRRLGPEAFALRRVPLKPRRAPTDRSIALEGGRVALSWVHHRHPSPTSDLLSRPGQQVFRLADSSSRAPLCCHCLSSLRTLRQKGKIEPQDPMAATRGQRTIWLNILNRVTLNSNDNEITHRCNSSALPLQFALWAGLCGYERFALWGVCDSMLL